jgi:hypothetical protein
MSHFKISFTAIALLILVCAQNEVFSQNANDALRVTYSGFGSSARALGMGNSYTALSDDASAAFFNPAGFGLIRKIELSGGFSYLRFKNQAQFFGDSTEYSNSNTSFNRASLAIPVPTKQGSLVFGLSYHNNAEFTGALKFSGINNSNSWINYYSLQNNNVPYDLYLSYPLYDSQDNYIKDTTNINGGLNQSGDIINSGYINNWTVSGATEVIKNLFVGANVNFAVGKYESNNEYYEDDINSIYQGETSPGEPQTTDFQTFYLNRLLKWEVNGWDVKLGMIYQLDNARFGVTVQFPKDYNINEEFIVNGRSDYSRRSYYLDSHDYSDEVEYKIKTPYEVSAGLSLNLVGLVISGDATLIDYSQINFENVSGLSGSYVSELNKNIKQQLKPVVNFNVGAELTLLFLGLRLRGGLFVRPSPYVEDDKSFDKKYLTAGVGILAQETFGIDVALVHGWWKDFGDNYGTNLSRTYQNITVDQILLTTTIRF